MGKKEAIIIGAGPAGLTAAFELLQKTDVKPVIFEISDDIGGISKTVNYKGNRMDIGGHRFFSKSKRVMQWWLNIFPLQGSAPGGKQFTGDLSTSGTADGPDPDVVDGVMLARTRLSRILFERRFFDYPLSLNLRTISNLGWKRTAAMGLSYTAAKLHPIREQQSLEDFLIDRFGKILYGTFFKDYTEKVWGVPCSQISPEWGSQRIRALSIRKVVLDALRSLVTRDVSIDQSRTETSLIRQFLYPKFGPGQLWEEVAAIVRAGGGEIHLRQKVTGLRTEGHRIVEVLVHNQDTGEVIRRPAAHVFSTMPVRELIAGLGTAAPSEVRTVAEGLMYRDFITVGLLLEKMKTTKDTAARTETGLIPDNWIYIQEKDVKVGRLQIFNNWSPYMVRDRGTPWMGLEYFCNVGDELWNRPDDEMKKFAIEELERLGIIDSKDVLDGTVIHMPYTYPAYFGTYDRFATVRAFTDEIENLFLIGRNGMHRYNNQDHSMLTAMTAVENLMEGRISKENIWAVNAERQYHEQHENEDRPSTIPHRRHLATAPARSP